MTFRFAFKTSFGHLEDVLARCLACLGKTSLRYLVDVFLPTGLFSPVDFIRILKPSTLQQMNALQLFFRDFAKTFRTPFSGAALNGEKCKMRNIEAATKGVLHK